MSKVGEAYSLAEELLAKVEDGQIDFDEAIEIMQEAYPQLSTESVQCILNDVVEIG